mmetsp:Transcript_14550/g.29774  ORF Transcript_14550/g.29774 Transcript_14550/m.29774 type:complete len:115 (+) Transcript_14550:59-403(+)
MGRAFVLSLGEITLLGAALLSLGYFAGSSKAKFRLSSSSTTALSKGAVASTTDSEQRAFVLAVNLKFTTLTHRDTFLQLIDPVCKDVLAKEWHFGNIKQQHYRNDTFLQSSHIR